MPKKSGKIGSRRHRAVAEHLAARRRDFDSLSSDQQRGRKRPGSMSGRKG